MNGHSRKFWPPPDKEQVSKAIRSCDHPGCSGSGEYRAPKSRDSLNEYYWFCLEHVRAYNQAWDYYAGLTTDEIEQMVRRDTTWQRPTWPLGRLSGGRFRFDREDVKDPFGVFDEDMWDDQPQRHGPPSPEEEALRVMNLRAPITVEGLKARYKELCKLHHPDANGGDKAAEERFKQIGQAYKTLLDSLHP